ncbi:MAG TPA: hypothetical protein VD867_08640 [Burkholderiales bacterium]|nr:hypothetical protein [Burkholderiales bacterium]
MDAAIIARVLHILGVVLWIGGVAMVTTVLLPATKRITTAAERVRFFETVERGFGLQARVTTLVTGLSGLYLVHAFDLWHRFAQLEFWWMHAMVLVWGVFTLVLFVLEPLFLHRWLIDRASRDPESTFALIVRLHWVMLGLSLATVAGAVAGSHGFRLGP